jgi:hypothetical protein
VFEILRTNEELEFVIPKTLFGVGYYNTPE